MNKVVRLTERELVNLIKRVLKEESEPLVKLDLAECLKSEFNLSSNDGLNACVKISRGDASIETLKLCASELAKKTNSEQSEGVDKLEQLTNCLSKKKSITEEIDPFQTQREQEIKNNFCSVDEGGLIQLSGKFKGKKWEEFLCTMDILPTEIQKFITDVKDTECFKGKVVNYFKPFEDIKKLTDEITKIKNVFPPPPGKKPKEIRGELFKGIEKMLDGKTVQFYDDYKQTKKTLVGYIRKVKMNRPGVFEFTINKFDPTTKKVLDWGEGYVLNPKKPRVYEYICCNHEDTEICVEELIVRQDSDSRGFLPYEKTLNNKFIEDLLDEYCYSETDKPKNPDYTKNQSSLSQLTEDTDDKIDELGAKVLVDKTAAFSNRKSRLGRGRIKDIEIMTDENGNKIFSKLKIVVTNIDENNNEIPKGKNITNTKTLLFDCNSDSMMIYMDEDNRQYPPNYIYTNRELVKVLKNGYCANVKRAKLDYSGGPRTRR